MAKVTLKKPVKTTPFKVNLQDDQKVCIDHLQRLLKENKDLQYDYHQHFSEAIIKEAKSAIRAIEKLLQTSPPPIPIPPPQDTAEPSLFRDYEKYRI